MSKKLLLSAAKIRQSFAKVEWDKKLASKEDFVGLPPEFYYEVDPNLMAMSGQDNYNLSLLGVDDFVENVAKVRGIKRKVLFIVIDNSSAYKNKLVIPDSKLLMQYAYNGTGGKLDTGTHFHSAHCMSSIVGVPVNGTRVGITHTDDPEISQWAYGVPFQGLKGTSGSTVWLKNCVKRAIEVIKSDFSNKEEWAVVVSNSWGGRINDTEFKDLFAELSELAFVTASAGNSGDGGSSVSRVLDPGRFPSTYCIGAVDRNRNMASFSSRSSDELLEVDYVGGGVSIIGAGLENGQIINASGTSMSCPNVSGAMGWLLACFPEITSMAELKSFLNEYSVDLGDEGKDRNYGYGLVNIESMGDYNDDPVDNPDEPGDDPDNDEPVEEPTVPTHTVRCNYNKMYTGWWTKAGQSAKVVNIDSAVFECVGELKASSLYDTGNALVDIYWNGGNRGVQTPPEMGFDLAVFYLGFFLEFLISRNKVDNFSEVRISEIVGTVDGRTVVFNKEDYDEFYKQSIDVNVVDDEQGGATLSVNGFQIWVRKVSVI